MSVICILTCGENFQELETTWLKLPRHRFIYMYIDLLSKALNEGWVHAKHPFGGLAILACVYRLRPILMGT